MVHLHLSRLLEERHMSQAELSRITGIRPNTINNLYHGASVRITLDYLDRICEAFDCDLDQLLTRTKNPIPKVNRGGASR